MAVTELALIKLKPSYDHLDLLDVLMDYVEAQDEWVRKTLRSKRTIKSDDNFSSVYVSKDAPSCLLITAVWEAQQDHENWLKSREHEEAFDQFADFLPPGSNSITRMLLDPAGTQTTIPPTLTSQGNFYVHITLVDTTQKPTMQSVYNHLEDVALDDGPHIWGGWRVQKASHNEDMVVFVSGQEFSTMSTLQNEALGMNSRCFQAIG